MSKIKDISADNVDVNVDSDVIKKKRRRLEKFFFNRTDYIAFGISFLISFVVYFITTAPTVTLEDSGELAVAGDYLGVPHPPGYPLWTLCAFIFTRIFRFVTYMGQPNPAWAIGLMSGFFGAFAAGITAMLINKCTKELLSHVSKGSSNRDLLSPNVLSITCLVSAVSGSLAFAFSPVEWSQSTIIEVYTLNSFFLMLIFLFIFKWLCKPSVKLLWLVAFLFGLGFTNYQVLLFMAVPMIIAVLLHSIPLFRDFVLLFVPVGLTIKLMELGAKYPEPGFAKLYPDPSNLNSRVPSIVPQAEFEGLIGYYIISIILILAICVCGIILATLEKNDEKESFLTRLLMPLRPKAIAFKIALSFFVIALVFVALSVSPIKPPPEFALAPKEAIMSFMDVYLIFAIGLVFLIGLGFCYKGGLWYSISIFSILISLLIFVVKGCMLGLTHPLTGYFWFYVVLNFVFLLMAWLMLPNGRAVAGTVFFAELGAAFYGYMPLASETNPPMNWGYPKTWEGFKHAVSRGQYEKIVPITLSQVLSPNFVRQLGSYFSDLRMQFTLVLAPLGFIPFALWSIKVKGKRFSVFPIAFGLAAAIALLAALDKVIDPTSANDLGGAYKYLMGLILLMATVGVALILCRIEHLLLDEVLDKTKDIYTRIITALCLVGVIAGVLEVIVCVSNIGAEYILEAGFGISEPVVGVASVAELAMSIALTVVISLLFIAIYALMGVFSYKKIELIKTDHSDISCKWFVITLIAFLMMSVVLIGMANPRGDIQDNFIQKVKFISSHAIFAIWIGYGIAMSIYLFRKQKWLLIPALAVSALLFIIPIRENYVNADMADITSAAEQNGHDFGWQFGNYQLRGANAINEELSSDEEPLPNPEYPPEMTPNAIFFGGTDPGRFVPTYMIYSAKVRPDVFLITQNALADPTYLDTMRSLYADQIWMPTAIDNSNAFNEYVYLVRTGQLPNLGGISDHGGRIQVNGAMEVMEINAIITKQIFDKNIAFHDFYVEESYAMRWMNPYLTPHGLIMKLNNKELSYPEFNASVQNDMDFWDWYTRRLTSNPAYERDVAARRAFSKLRASIAGLYATRNMVQASERSFIDGIILYPYSPECTIRYMRELLYPYGRLEDAILYIEKLVYKDKNNQQAQAALSTLRELYNAQNKIKFLYEKNISAVKKYNEENPTATISEDLLVLPDADMLELVKTANIVGNSSLRYVAIRDYFLRKDNINYNVAFAMLNELIMYSNVSNEELMLVNLLPKNFFQTLNDVEAYRVGADIYMRLGDVDMAIKFLSTVLRIEPNDWRSWSSYCTLQYSKYNNVQRSVEILSTAEQASKASGEYEEFRALVASHPLLEQLYAILIQMRTQGAPNGGANNSRMMMGR